jgi:thiol-disulfide isomerase/thioredoxin
MMQMSSKPRRTRLLLAIFWSALVLSVVLTGSGCSREEPPSVRVGERAPVFTALDLNTGKKTALSDMKGKVIIVDFWASWCAPCQKPMAAMQTYRDIHPEWADAVQLLAVSIDETSDAAKAHIAKKGWNKTRNVWLDPKGGKNPYMVAYAGQGIPAEYIIGADGVIAEAGHPGEMDIAAAVKSLLAGESKR